MLEVASVLYMMDLFVAVLSLMFGLGFFAFIAALLCSAAFLLHAMDFPA